MVTTAMPKSSYRFILYGRAKSGKTCYFAALAMDHQANPRRYTCDWLNTATHCPRPTSDEQMWDYSDPAVARYSGRQWLQEAIDTLEKGQTPKGNPNEAAPVRYLFEFRGADDYPESPSLNRIFTVELIDYSGELIDPDLSEQRLAKLVRGHMLDADGIVVLAEAPPLHGDWTVQYPELRKLRAAFHLIRRADIPVALVINKWDRLQGQHTLESFLTAPNSVDGDAPHTTEPPHLALHDALKGAVGDGNLHAFAASALGPCIIREEFNVDRKQVEFVESPKELRPLRSFGLEDPFIWLSRRHDELQIESISRAADDLAYWKIWQFPSGVHRSLHRALASTRGFVSDVPAWRRTLEAAARRAHIMRLIHASALTIALALFAFCTVLYGIALHDRNYYRDTSLALGLPQPDTAAELSARISDLEGRRRTLAAMQFNSVWRIGSRLMHAIRGDNLSELHDNLGQKIHACTNSLVKQQYLEAQLSWLDARDQEVTTSTAQKTEEDIKAVENALKDREQAWTDPIPPILASKAAQLRDNCTAARTMIRREFRERIAAQIDEARRRIAIPDKLSVSALEQFQNLIAAAEEKGQQISDELDRYYTKYEFDHRGHFTEKLADLKLALIEAKSTVESATERERKRTEEAEAIGALELLRQRADACATTPQLNLVQEDFKRRAENWPSTRSEAWRRAEEEAQNAIAIGTQRIAEIGVSRQMQKEYDAEVSEHTQDSLDKMARVITQERAATLTRGPIEAKRTELGMRFRTGFSALLTRMLGEILDEREDADRMKPWKNALALLDVTRRSPAVNSLVKDQIKLCDEFRQSRVLRPLDQYLYDRVFRHPDDENACVAYLAEINETRKMEPSVRDLHDFLKTREEKFDCQLVVSKIQVSAAKNGTRPARDKHSIFVYVTRAEDTLVKTSKELLAYGKAFQPEDGAGAFRGVRRSDAVTFNIRAYEAYQSFFGDKGPFLLGKTSVAVQLAELAENPDGPDGNQIPLVAEADDSPQVTIYLRIDGWKGAPSLPPYGN